MPNKIMMIAGEASGDLLGASLARELYRLQPDLNIIAMGGEQMCQAGVHIVVDNRSMDIIGWWGVIRNLSIIYRAMKKIKSTLKNDPPDLLILIDYPGFNLRVAKWAKKKGIKILYYVSPQIWAWKYGRIKTIRHCVCHMAVLFSFEEDIYRKENVPVTFVGHPLASLVKATESKETIFRRYGLHSDYPVIALFPGSRRPEVQRLLPIIVSSIPKIRAAIPGVQFVLPLASSLQSLDLQPYLTDDITIVKNDTYNLLSICTAAIVKSGTGTLEVAFSGVPLVVIYKGNFLNYWIAKSVVRITQIGLCNIVAKKQVAKELIQGAVTPENIAAETIRLVVDPPYRKKIISDLAALRASMADKKSAEQVAVLAMQMVQ